MKPLRVVLAALAALVVAGTIANAAPGLHGKPSPSPSVLTSDSPSPEPTETESPEPTETETPDATDAGSNQTAAPDFSACVGLTGLDNAVCRHEALLKVNPDNVGLANSLAHLQANAAAQGAKHGAPTAGEHGKSGQHGNSGQHGKPGA